MASGEIRGKKTSGRRVTNKSLQLGRTPHAFALFLKHMTGKCEWYKGRRLGAKTMIWRMDLLSMRFRNLPAVERNVFLTQSAAALAQRKGERATILHDLRSAPSESGNASTVVEESHGNPLSSSVRVLQPGEPASSSAQVWLSLPVPALSPVCTSGEGDAAASAEQAAVTGIWPCDWRWMELPSGVVRHFRCATAVLGSGSYGCCLSVKDSLTGEVFCLKLPRSGTARESVAEVSLKHEYKILKDMRHTNVVHAVAWLSSLDGNSEGFIMTLADGNLWQWLDTSSAITRGDGVSSLVQVGRGLTYLHGVGIVHLDLKPENIVATRTSAGCSLFQVADFGQCMHAANGKIASDMVNSELYRPLYLFHTACAEVRVRFSFDLWAFGCVIFDVLQAHPRLRSSQGRFLRLFSGVQVKGDFHCALRVRNYRLVNKLAKAVVAAVVRFQPNRPVSLSSDRAMHAEHVGLIMNLE